MTDDVFGTAALRRAVLEAWRSSPTRLREDANTEEDHAHGSYRGRVVVELAQNAADAAARAGVPGRLRLSLHAPSGPDEPWVLRAANTGEPLDASGVASLVALRASATGRSPRDADGRTPTVGRFGVGFAAVRAVSDRVRVGTGERAVELSVARTRAALDDVVADRPDLAAEVARRGDRLPALRLPFPARVEVPPGYDTVVEVELRDADALAAVRAELADVGDPLLLALPALAEVVVAGDGVEERRVADVADRWTVLRREGTIDAALLADRPVEERASTRWSVTWALPDDGARTDVLHAPTPTDERLTFPALLLATFPLDPARRHVPPGPVTAHVARAAGRAYAELLGELAPERGADVLALVPTGLPASAVDAEVRASAEAALARTPLLPLDAPVARPAAGVLRADDDVLEDGGAAATVRQALVTPAEACVLAGDVGDARVRSELGVAHLVDVPGPLRAVARSLGTRVVDLADVVDDLPLVADPARWRSLYDALAPHAGDRSVLEVLGALPVPLLGGQVVRGARGLLLLDAGPGEPSDGGALDARDAAELGLRVVDPRAAHPLLERLGARATHLRTVLSEGAVRERVLAASDAADAGDDPTADVDRLLALVAAAVRAAPDPARAGLPFWWGELPVPTADGGWSPVRGCALPGTWAADALDTLDLVDPAVVDRWGEPVLRAVGAADGLGVLRVRDVLTPASDDEPDLDPHAPEGWLSDWGGYLAYLAATLGPEAYVGDVLAVADLDAVADAAWPDALARLATEPGTREALLAPVRAEGGRTTTARSYTAWWLREELGGAFALGSGLRHVPFLRPAPPDVAGLDDEVLAALGGVRDLAELAPDEWVELLDDLPDVGEAVDARAALTLWRALGALAARGERLDPPPERLPALRAGAVRVVGADDVAVAPDPMWSPVRAVLPAPPGLLAEVADLLDVRTVPRIAPAPDAPGRRGDVPEAVRAVLDGAAPRTWERHDDLRVGGVAVPWWVEHGGGADAVVHATGPAGLAAGLAVATGRHGARFVLEQALRDPDAAQDALARTAWDDPQSSEDAR
ncbi:sacsin N-terminal ATP-binding-like domain-containing protein [Cellulosimicrobium cellulans]|uniref:sacsin N-terminal ATP-binding-like domain-containing protein n=1 Tax=Cellulosimicrobium cellulans TaxID=1710 RepID=UPI002096F0C1|nr:ATP-binding protein [Cellulosimicrobium cellulans]MCO7274034.1 ATP-binding protein [Cellulosimicrobium cellulans]